MFILELFDGFVMRNCTEEFNGYRDERRVRSMRILDSAWGKLKRAAIEKGQTIAETIEALILNSYL